MLITTIVAANYLAQARVLARSFLAHHPGGRVAVLVVDDDPAAGPVPGRAGRPASEPFERILPADLPLSTAELHRLATIYDVLELSTALKPFLLAHLLARGEPAVIYLDPDIQVFAPLDELAALAARHDIVLTPHRLDPVPLDDRQPEERTFSLSGVFNLGFIGVGPGGGPFLARWGEHCRRHCIVAHDEGLFVDQRWIDLASTYYGHQVVRDPGCNVAYWNLDSRPLTLDADGYRAGGAPLRFFHFSGFDPRQPHLLSRHQGSRPRNLLSELPLVADLTAQYAARLAAEGSVAAAATPYGWAAMADGTPLQPLMRRVLRDDLLAREHRPDGPSGPPDDFPDPFDPDGARATLQLLATPLAHSPHPRVGRYLESIYRLRPDVAAAFPQLTGPGADDFLAWADRWGRHEHAIPDALLTNRTEPLAPPPASGEHDQQHGQAPGLNVVGYFTAELGLGEAGRAMVATLDEVGERYALVTETGTANRQRHPVPAHLAGPQNFDINLICVNSDQLPRVAEGLGPTFRAGRHTIGLWAWEVEHFPATMLGGAGLVDEIWTYSAHAQQAIAAALDRPVRRFPLPVIAHRSAQRTRRELGLPEGDDFLFLFCFDFYSIAARKNPLGLVEAFTRAFRPGEGPRLLIKSINGHLVADQLEQLRYAARERPDVTIWDRYLDIGDQRALLEACDCYVSLHRAEGFGYTMAEAMLAAKPVIATGYSGNLEFMDETNSFLVAAGRSSIPSGCEPYPAGTPWAEPDLDDAARLMQLVVADRARREAVAARAHHDIATFHSPQARAPLMAARLAEIRANRATVTVAAPPHPAATAGRLAWRSARRIARLAAPLLGAGPAGGGPPARPGRRPSWRP